MKKKVPTKTPLQKRREEEKELRRQAILDAVEKVFAKRGWEALTFGDVAKQCRLSRALVYFYFPTKADLFHGVCARASLNLSARFQKVMSRQVSGIDQLMALGRAYLAFSIEDPTYFALMSMFQLEEDLADGPDCDDPAHVHGRECLALVVQAVANGVADKSVRPGVGDPRATAVAVWAFTHGLIQIATQKGCMLQRDLGLTGDKALEHGFRLLRDSMATES